jgi:GntR family transcriptional regulator, transcriptional repressor for pyruvate dehydrogenase complex
VTGKTSPAVGQLPPVAENELASREALMHRLEQIIVSGEWSPGTKIPSERDLVTHFNLSRPAVREVLRGLEERGYLDVRPARGSFVRELTTSDAARPLDVLLRRTGVTARELVVARRMLECECAALAAQNADEEARARIAAVLEAQRSVTELEHRAQLDVAFHEAIARASGNSVLHIMFSSIRGLVLALVLRSLSDREVRQAGEPWHDAILKAILDSDPEAAREAMRQHLELALDTFGADLDQPLSRVLEERAALTAQVAEVVRDLDALSWSAAAAEG